MKKTLKVVAILISPLAYLGFAVGFLLCPIISGFWYGLNYIPMLNGEDYADMVEQAILDKINANQSNADIKLYTEDEDENNA